MFVVWCVDAQGGRVDWCDFDTYAEAKAFVAEVAILVRKDEHLEIVKALCLNYLDDPQVPGSGPYNIIPHRGTFCQ